jgi:hypothetical protein
VLANSLKTDGAGGVVMSRKREKRVRIETAGSLGCESQLFIKPETQQGKSSIVKLYYSKRYATSEALMARRLHKLRVKVASIKKVPFGVAFSLSV